MFQILRKNALASTNSYATELLQSDCLQQPTVIVADSQLKGRGQAQNQWFSEEGKSLTFSIVVFPKHIRAERQFVLSQVICLAVQETLAQYTQEVSIKWPNDIYIKGVKCCGILIESAVMGTGIAHSICGIGLNVNNLSFSEGYTATSLAKETGNTFDLEHILNEILLRFQKYYEKAETLEYAELNTLYHNKLYKIEEYCRFKDNLGKFKAKVIGIDQYGQLLLKDTDEQLRTYGFKEIEWLFG